MSLLKQKVELEIEEAEFNIGKKLNQFPPLIKWAIIIAAIGIIPAYLITVKISVGYWQKKYSPLELTGKPSFTNPIDLEIVNLGVLAYNNNFYSALAEITNKNLELSAPEIYYQFVFFDQQGKEIAVSSGDTKGQTFILPDQTKYVVSAKVASLNQIKSAQLQITKKILWQNKLSIPKVKLTTSLPTYGNQADPLAFTVSGYVQNASSYQLSQARLIFIIYGASKQIAAVSQRDEFDLKPYERRAYQQLWPNMSFGNIQNVKVVAETNVLDPSNLKVDTTSASPASDLSRPKTQQ